MKECKNLFHLVSPGDNAPKEINVLIEISRGSRTKYEYNKDFGIIEVDRILHTPIPYPFSYGLIPQTWNDYDHDPLDVIVVCSEPLMPEAMVKCRVIGMISVDDNGERDDKILTVVSSDPYHEHVECFNDLTIKEREDMVYFMEHYKDLEEKEVKILGWENSKKAQEFINECLEVYKKKF